MWLRVCIRYVRAVPNSCDLEVFAFLLLLVLLQRLFVVIAVVVVVVCIAIVQFQRFAEFSTFQLTLYQSWKLISGYSFPPLVFQAYIYIFMKHDVSIILIHTPRDGRALTHFKLNFQITLFFTVLCDPRVPNTGYEFHTLSLSLALLLSACVCVCSYGFCWRIHAFHLR